MYTIWPEYWDFGVKDGVYGPQIATCDIPRQYSSQVPQAISIQTTGDCSQMNQYPSNVLRVKAPGYDSRRNATQARKPSIGICVQAFRFRTYDVSVRLVEWLEMVSKRTNCFKRVSFVHKCRWNWWAQTKCTSTYTAPRRIWSKCSHTTRKRFDNILKSELEFKLNGLIGRASSTGVD